MQQKRRSVLDPKYKVNYDEWVVAICRKPQGDNPEHAFLLVEGETQSGKGILKRYDLFRDRDNPAMGFISIRPKPKKKSSPEEILNTLNTEILDNDRVYVKAWDVKKSQVEKLHKAICADKENPPRYEVSGNRSLIVKSSHSSDPNVHSCFSWLRAKLINLGHETEDNRFARDLKEGWESLLVERTSRYIGDEENKKRCSCM